MFQILLEIAFVNRERSNFFEYLILKEVTSQITYLHVNKSQIQSWNTGYFLETKAMYKLSDIYPQCLDYELALPAMPVNTPDGNWQYGILPTISSKTIEKDWHLKVELPKILCRWLERENIYIFRTRYWTKSYAMFISTWFYLKPHFSTFGQSGTSRAENLQANPTCYFHDPSLGLRATGTCFSRQQQMHPPNTKAKYRNTPCSVTMEWTWCTRSSSAWSKLTQEVEAELWTRHRPSKLLPAQGDLFVFSLVWCVHAQSHSTLIQEWMSLEFYFHSA